ncbi:MAG TPA: ABC transporter ATP-binding protein [Burkholderiales bacterium]|jgi:branched-chain amino acid transport system ATP-binding protein/nonpolar-amino-acid-transporting ATPase
MTVLRVEGIEAGYGGLPVLRGVSLAIDRNEAVAIIGANGAGKSTLVRAICGLLPVSAGRIAHHGREIQTLPAHARSQHGVAVVLENRHLFGELSVRNNLTLAAIHGARRGETDRRFRLDDVLELFPFMRARLDAPVQLLSGGEQQMVAIARALLLHPELLIMDEPSTGLSPKVVREIVGVMARLREAGMSILLVEQNVALAAETSERGYVMSLGRVVHEIRRGEWHTFRNDARLLRAYLGGERADTP